jgi:hypothetical protein
MLTKGNNQAIEKAFKSGFATLLEKTHKFKKIGMEN